MADSFERLEGTVALRCMHAGCSMRTEGVLGVQMTEDDETGIAVELPDGWRYATGAPASRPDDVRNGVLCPEHSRAAQLGPVEVVDG